MPGELFNIYYGPQRLKSQDRRAGVRRRRKTIADAIRAARGIYDPRELQERTTPAAKQFQKSSQIRTKAIIPVATRSRDSRITINGRVIAFARDRGTLRRSMKTTVGRASGKPAGPRKVYVRIDRFPTNFLVGASRFRGKYKYLSSGALQIHQIPPLDVMYDQMVRALDRDY